MAEARVRCFRPGLGSPAGRRFIAVLRQLGNAFFRIVPRRVQAWREVNELPGRALMRDGTWLT